MIKFETRKYVEADESSDLVDWHHSLDEKGKGMFAARMEYLCACPTPADWTMPYCRQLRDGIIEIRFKSRNVQQRPLGYFGPRTKNFTFLFPAKEKGDKFVPKDAIDRAISRRGVIEEDPRRSHGWDIQVIT